MGASPKLRCMTKRRRAAFSLACTVAAMASTLAVADTAAAYSTGGVTAGPLHWDPSNPATRSYYIPTIQPGGSFHDYIRVGNPNSDVVDLDVSAVDGITATPSGAVYANRSDPVRKAGVWVTPDQSTLTLAAGAQAQVGFTVRVPADAVPGDHLAGVALENAHANAGSGNISISSVVRTVVGVLVEVPGPAVFSLHVGAASIQPLTAEGLASVVVPLTDTGGRLGKPSLTVMLSGPNGYRRSITRHLDTLLPGDTIDYPFPWPDTLGPGIYTIAVSAIGPGMSAPATSTASAPLRSGLQGVPTPGPVATRPTAPVDAAPSWLVPVAAGGGALVILLLGAVAYLTAVLRRQRRPAATDPG